MSTINYSRAGGGRSTFGTQSYSHRVSAPSVGFGTGSRASAQKLFVGHEHAKTGSSDQGTPAAQYGSCSSVGTQIEGARNSEPQWRIGTATRFGSKFYNTDSPGPAAYDNRTSSVAKQPFSSKSSSAHYGFGTSTRLGQDKRFISALHSTDSFGHGTPGPTTALQGGEESRGRKSAFSKADRFNNSSNSGHMPPISPGPAAYSVGGGSIGGKWMNSSMTSEPAFGFGTLDREKRSKVFMSQLHSKGSSGMSPGPASINNAQSSIGRQYNTRGSTSPTWGFPRAERFSNRHDSDTPGPGAYTC